MESSLNDNASATPEESYRSVLIDAVERAPYGFDIVDENGRFISANRACVRMWGYDGQDEIIGASPTPHCVDDGVPERIKSELRKTGVIEIEFRARRKDGSQFDVLMYAHLGHLPDGTEIYYGTSLDISDRNARTVALQNLTKQKDTLLKELYHRTKNSMQLVLSMLHLRSSTYPGSSNAKNLADEMERRILAMVVVHDHVYEAQDLSRIDLGSYLNELVRFVAAEKPHAEVTVGVDLPPQPVLVGVDTAITCGHIVSELVHNSIVHAMYPPDDGQLSIAVHQSDLQIVVQVTDNGTGIPDGFSLDSISTV